MNCCLQFLFLNSIAGAFIFIILGIFVIADNPFLIVMNLKDKDKGIYEDNKKRNAYGQYFTSAGFNIFFAFIIWFIPKLINIFGNKKQKGKQFNRELQIINENEEIKNLNDNNNIIIKENDENEIIHTDTNNQIASINTVNSISTGNNLGMMEKTED